MALYVNGKKVVNSLVVDGNAYDKAVIFEGTASTDKWAEPLVYSSVNALDYEVLCFSGTDQGYAFRVYYNIADLPVSPNPVQDENYIQFSSKGYLYVGEDGVLYFCVSSNFTLVLNEVIAYKESDNSGGGGLIPVSLANETHNVETNRAFSVTDNTITSVISASTYCTGVVTLPVSAFTKDEFILEYDIGTPSYSSPQYFARAVFSDNPPSSTWITDEGYGYTALVQSTTAWTGLMQRFKIPQGAQYFNIELGVTSFSAIKFWED